MLKQKLYCILETMKYRLYTTSWKAWDAMLLAIDQAKKSIYIEMYIFLDDTSGSHDFVGKLKQKAQEGVRVIIVADAFGSSEIKKESIEALREAGVEFLFFSHWLRHIHRKILIIDERLAFLGGVNIGKKFSQWKDLQLRLHGRVVKRIMKSFAYTYAMASGKDKKILAYREKLFSTKFRFWLVEYSPFRNIHSLKDQYRQKISRAEKSIQIATPYFAPPRWLIAILDSAIHRGVIVEIIIPKKTDLPFIDRINHRFMYNLSKTGINFFLTPVMNHAKIMLIDRKIGLVGSQNIDYLSFNLNAEAGIFFEENDLVAELRQTVDEWKNEAEQFRPQKYKMKAVDYLILAVIKLFRPIL
jgi:cardiolipin synthase A/B